MHLKGLTLLKVHIVMGESKRYMQHSAHAFAAFSLVMKRIPCHPAGNSLRGGE